MFSWLLIQYLWILKSSTLCKHGNMKLCDWLYSICRFMFWNLKQELCVCVCVCAVSGGPRHSQVSVKNCWAKRYCQETGGSKRSAVRGTQRAGNTQHSHGITWNMIDIEWHNSFPVPNLNLILTWYIKPDLNPQFVKGMRTRQNVPTV